MEHISTGLKEGFKWRIESWRLKCTEG